MKQKTYDMGPVTAEVNPVCCTCRASGKDRYYRIAWQQGDKVEYVCNLCDVTNWNKEDKNDLPGPDGGLHRRSPRTGRSMDH